MERTEISAQAWREIEWVLLRRGINYETDFVEENGTVHLNVDIEPLAVKPE